MTPLSPRQARVMGSLIEKQLTTPQQYPLTANALLLACNQSSNRDPVVAYTEGEVTAALGELRERRLVRFVLPSHGRSVVRYRQVLDEVLGLDPLQLALVGVLLLRGAQTVGELRGRGGRMADVGSLEGVERELTLLAEHDPPLVARMPRRPGQKEDRWTELLCRRDGVTDDSVAECALAERALAEHGMAEHAAPDGGAADRGSASGAGASPGADADAAAGISGEVARLRDEVGALREEVGSLRAALHELRSSLGG